jgi:subfamily B ATP-binding cassette protein MsbA
VRPHRGTVLASVVLGALASVLEVCSIGLVGPLLLVSSQGLSGVSLGPFSRVVPLLSGLSPNGQRGVLVAMIVGGIAVRGVCAWLAAALRERAASRVQGDARRRVFARLARAPRSWHDAHPIGEQTALVLHETEKLGLAVSTLVTLAMGAAMSAAYLLLLVYLAPKLTLAAVAFLALTAFGIRLFRNPVETHAHRMRAESREVGGRLHETLAALHLLQAVGRLDEAVERFDASSRRFLDAQRSQRQALEAIPPVSEWCGAAVVLAILWLGSTWIPIRGDANALLLLPYVFVFYRLLPRFLSVLSARAMLAAYLPSIPPVEDFLASPDSAPLPDGGAAVPAERRRIAFEGVRFRYAEAGPDVLVDFDLVLDPGTTTALVGPSGAGKSTVVELLLGLRRPTAGRVLVDGRDLAEVSGEAWRRRVGVVPQEPTLFDWTVRENLRLTAPDASDEEIHAALDAAAAGFARSLPQGLDTRLSDRGSRLSGGERQRLSIARALLQDPSVLVFDEPTSQLDADSERAVAAAIARVAKTRTALVVAHRLSTVRAADRIVLLDRGRVVEAGSHDALMAKDGAYARLVRLGRDDLEPSARS